MHQSQEPIFSPAPPSPVWAPASPPQRRKRPSRLGERYLTMLSLVLLGYALGGRGFAYWGVKPLFIGEMTLLFGLVVLFKTGVVGRVLQFPQVVLMLMFMAWGLVCTIPHFSTYGFESIRDAVAWGYAVFAIVLIAVLVARPERLRTLVVNYRTFVYCFLLLGPLFWALSNFIGDGLPAFPGGGVPIIQTKGGDMCVHLGGVFSYAVTFGAWIAPWIPPLFVPVMMALNMHGRAAMLSFAAAVGATLCLRPFHPRAWRIFSVVILALFILWLSDFRMEMGARELSFKQLMDSIASLTGDTGRAELDGSKQWRLKWWSDIFHYTFGDDEGRGGKYFWFGKGFGINLANADGYQVDDDEGLRSPHNSHLTYLARGGVPLFLLWGLIQATWAISLVRAFFTARARGQTYWSGVFLFLVAYWLAFMANATFDVFLEGPMGGIWYWNLYGAGVAAVYIYRRRPDVLAATITGRAPAR